MPAFFRPAASRFIGRIVGRISGRISGRIGGRLVGLAIGLVTGLVAVQIPASSQETNQTVFIAVAGPMTQPRGQSTRDAAQFAIDRVNKRGLRIDGKNITLELLQIDDKNSPHMAVSGARAAVAAGVVAVIGHLTTEASTAAAAVYNRASIAQLSPTSAGRAFTQQGYANVFQLIGHSTYTGRYLAETAVKYMHAERIMLIDNDTMLGKELAASFRATVVRLGGAVVETDSINAKSSDFNATIAKIRNSNPDMIYFAGVTPQSNAFSVRLRQAGFRTPLLLGGAAINAEFPDKTEEYPEGTLLMVSGNPVEKAPDFKRLEKTYREKFTTALIPFTWITCDAVEMLVEAMKKTDSLDPSLLSPALHQMKYKGLSGTISFAADGSLENPPYAVYRAEQGRWKTFTTLP